MSKNWSGWRVCTQGRGRTRLASRVRLALVSLDKRIVPSAAPPTIKSVIVGDGTAQRSSVTQLQVKFDQKVSLPASPENAFRLSRNSDGAEVKLNAVADQSELVTTVTLTFTGGAINGHSLADGRYSLIVNAAGVSGISGQLDGNRDGVGGDDFRLVGNPATNKLFRLFGDADGDGTVAAADFVAFRRFFNGSNPVFDFDGDGSVSAADFIQFRQRFTGAV